MNFLKNSAEQCFLPSLDDYFEDVATKLTEKKRKAKQMEKKEAKEK